MVIALIIFALDASSQCRVPQPRLICAEFANTQIVVVARLTEIRELVLVSYLEGREVVHDRYPEGHFYTLAPTDLLRGQMESTFKVWDPNTSARAPFEWITDTPYLLFLDYSKTDQAWHLDGCGNSGPLSQSAAVLAAIRSARASKADPVVEGMVSADAWTKGVPDVTVRALGRERTFVAKTDQAGRFQVQVPPGRYVLEAVRNGWSFQPEPFGYENPLDLTLASGGCAQVQFSGVRNR